jgi:regulatory protein
MSEAALAAAAERYLARYAASTGALRRVLVRKVQLSARHYGDDPAPLMPVIDQLVARHVAGGHVDDRLYADSQIGKLRRRGGSGRVIAQRLAAKGVPEDVIEERAAALADANDDFDSALRLARRRRLGPFRMTDRAEYRLKDLAILGRAGFGYEIAVRVVDGKGDD